MATNTSTIKSAGGTYTSRSAWNAVKGIIDLVTAGNIEQAETYDFEDTIAFTMATTAGYTNATNYFRIFTAAGNKHNGLFGTGARVVASVGSGYAINSHIPYTRIEDQSVDNTAASNGGVIDMDGKDYQTVTGNLLRAVGTTNRVGLDVSYVVGLVMKNNTVISPSSTSTVASNNSTGNVYNNTAINTGATGNAINLSSASLTCKNNIAQGGVTSYLTTSYTGTASNNLSEDATAPGTSAVISTVLTFTNSATYDYSLAAGDTAAHTAGIGNSSDAEVPTVDIIDVTRSTTIPSLGAFEYVAAGGSSIDTIASPIVDGETDFAFTVSGFAGPITSAVISCVEVPAFTLDLSASLAGTYTADMVDVTTYTVDTTGVPRTTANRNLILTVGDGTTTDDIAIVINPKTGWAVYEIISAINTEGSLFFEWTGVPSLPADYDQIQLPTADNTYIDPNGTFYTDKISGTLAGVYFDQTTGTWEPFTVLISNPNFIGILSTEGTVSVIGEIGTLSTGFTGSTEGTVSVIGEIGTLSTGFTGSTEGTVSVIGEVGTLSTGFLEVLGTEGTVSVIGETGTLLVVTLTKDTITFDLSINRIIQESLEL